MDRLDIILATVDCDRRNPSHDKLIAMLSVIAALSWTDPEMLPVGTAHVRGDCPAGVMGGIPRISLTGLADGSADTGADNLYVVGARPLPDLLASLAARRLIGDLDVIA